MWHTASLTSWILGKIAAANCVTGPASAGAQGIKMNVYHTTRPDWVDKVQDLKPGQHRRIADGRRASFNGKGYFLWDFREQTGEVWEPQLSLSEKLEAMAAVNAAGWEAASTTAQPEPRMYHLKDWPSEARVWLHQASLSNHDILNINAY